MEGIKRILLITQNFPPNLSKVGYMVRTVELANFLDGNGFDVNVLTCKRVKEWPGLLKVKDKVTVNQVSAWSSYLDVPKEEANLIQLLYKPVRNILRFIFRNKIIELEQIDKKKYLNTAVKIIEEKNIENVLISVPPHSLALIGLELKDIFADNINFILDYRDAWTLRKSSIKNKSKRMVRRIKEIEQRVISATDYTIFVSSGMEEAYLDEFKLNDYLVIENGFIDIKKLPEPDEGVLEKIRAAREKNKLIIGYFGTGSADGRMAYKDFGNLIKVLEKKENRKLNSRICFFIQGHVSLPATLPENLDIISFPPVSNEKARANMRLLDLALFVYSEKHDAPHVMGGKVYDYIASGVPLWLLIPENAKSLLSFAEKTKKSFVSNIFNEREIEKTLKLVLELKRKDRLKEHAFSEEEAKRYSRNKQYMKLLDILR